MFTHCRYVFLFVCFTSQVYSAISGRVTHYETGLAIQGARVVDPVIGLESLTDADGYFSFGSTDVKNSVKSENLVNSTMVNGHLALNMNGFPAEISIYNVSGRCVYKKHLLSGADFHLIPELVPGAYLIYARCGEMRYSAKLMHLNKQIAVMHSKNTASGSVKHTASLEHKLLIEKSGYFSDSVPAMHDYPMQIRLRPFRIASLLNYMNGDTVTYPLVRLYGEMDGSDCEMMVYHDSVKTSWPVFSGRFKAYAKLKHGPNDFILSLNDTWKALRLYYYPPQYIAKNIKLFFYLGSDGTGTIDAPPGIPNDSAEAIKRIKTAGLLMQSFFAETFKSSSENAGRSTGGKRKTFHFFLDENREPEVHIIRHSRTQQELWFRNDGYADWADARSLLHAAFPDAGNTVFIGFSGISHLNPETGEYKAGLALGGGYIEGGGLGMIHSGNLITYPADFDRLDENFSNNNFTETEYIVEDSQSRYRYWAAFATTLGGLMHEAGHGFSLPHSDSGIMSSDFGSINRFFMTFEPQTDNSRIAVNNANEVIYSHASSWWHKESVQILEESPFIY